MKPIIQTAIEFANKAHGAQKYGNDPYCRHLAHVAEVLERFHGDLMEAIKEFNLPYESWICAAWLHDTLEDTSTSYEDLVNSFGEPVARLVSAVTNESGTDALETAQRTYPKIGKTDGATVLKLADRIANVEASIQDQRADKLDKYRRLFPVMKQHLRPMEGKRMWQYLEDIVLSGKLPPRYFSKIPCSLCPNNAGILELLAPGSEKRSSIEISESWTWIVVALGFRTQKGIELDDVEKLKSFLAKKDVPGLYDLDWFLVPFYCEKCGVSYCEAHWKLEQRFDPDAPSYYEDTVGLCPKGHRRLVDD